MTCLRPAVAISFRLIAKIPFRVGWIAKITEFDWNSYFCDQQIQGPFASWKHRHGISAEVREGVNGTFISEEVEYRLPMGPLGGLADAMFVRRRMEAMFAYRQKRLEEILPVAARQAARRS